MGQAIILITGALAIWLTQQSNDSWKKFAAPIGLAGQPFWIWSTYQSDQWGMLGLSIFYSYTWALGIYNNWIDSRLCKSADKKSPADLARHICADTRTMLRTVRFGLYTQHFLILHGERVKKLARQIEQLTKEIK